MLMHLPAVNPLVAHVRALPGIFYLTSEVADALDTSPSTLRRLAAAHPDLAPTDATFYGRLRVELYDDATVHRLHDHLTTHPASRGRPRLWNDAERRARRAGHSSAGHYRRRAMLLTDRGDTESAAHATRQAQHRAAELRNQSVNRGAGLAVHTGAGS